MKTRITQEYLKSILHYNPDSGKFTNKITRSSGAIKDSISGSVNGNGYRNVVINSKIYLAHRLAWLYVYGYFPEGEIDHINRLKDDNRIENLREISRSCNVKNQGLSKSNKSGVKGVFQRNGRKGWLVSMRVNNKQEIFYFKNFDEAVKKRFELEIKYNYLDCATESTAYKYLKNNGLIS